LSRRTAEGTAGPSGKVTPWRQWAEVGRADAPLDFRLVDAGDLVAWMEEPVREVAVVGEEEQPLRIVVESPHGKEPRRVRGQEIHHHRPAFRILEAGEIASRLVKEAGTSGCRARRWGAHRR
jgi:hypothetical protein